MPPNGEIDGLFAVVYDELRRVAHRHLSGEQTGHTLDTTGLVHEAYLELIKFEKQHVKDSCRHADLVARIRRSMHNLEHDAASTIARHVSNW